VTNSSGPPCGLAGSLITRPTTNAAREQQPIFLVEHWRSVASRSLVLTQRGATSLGVTSFGDPDIGSSAGTMDSPSKSPGANRSSPLCLNNDQ